MKKQVILLLAFICFSTSMLTAQIAGTIDPAFGNGGPIVFDREINTIIYKAWLFKQMAKPCFVELEEL